MFMKKNFITEERKPHRSESYIQLYISLFH